MTPSSFDRSLVLPAPTPCSFGGCRLLLWHLGDHAPSGFDERYAPRVERRDSGRIVYWNLLNEAPRSGLGRARHGLHLEVAPERWVRVFGTGDDDVAIDRASWIGDEALGDGASKASGRIQSIGPNIITITRDRAPRCTQVSVATFLRWNTDADADRARAGEQHRAERIRSAHT
jgi:hypothetical protein